MALHTRHNVEEERSLSFEVLRYLVNFTSVLVSEREILSGFNNRAE